MLSLSEIKEIVMKYGLGTPDPDYFEYVMSNINPAMNKLDHPRVPFSIYYSSIRKTAVSFNVPANPKDITDNGDSVKKVYGHSFININGGDGSVPTASSLLPPMKWSIDPISKQYPIHLISYCSNVDFESEDLDLQKNQYINISCRCDDPSEEGCSHSSKINDPNLILHLENYAMNKNKRIPLDKLHEAIDLIGRGYNNVEVNHKCRNLKN
jgi:hypothetical protein